MQKEVLYKYSNITDFDVSDYQKKDLAVYNVQLTDSDIKQIKKLTGDSVTFTIPQLNINYCNSFNENYNITIQYAPIKIYDLECFVTGTIDSDANNRKMVNNDGNEIFTWEAGDPQHPGDTVHSTEFVWTSEVVEIKLDDTYQGTTVQPKAHTFSLQQQSINSLIEELNYPLKHIPYGTDNDHPIYHIIESNGKQYKTRIIGEIDISSQIFWASDNGKLTFHYNGINQIDTTKWTPLAMNPDGGYDDWIIFQGVRYGDLGKWPLPYGTGSSTTTGDQLTYLPQDVAGKLNYSYIPQYLDTYYPKNIFARGSSQDIYVCRLDSYTDNKIFYVDNFYWANQLMGFMQTPQRMFTFLEQYPNGSSYSESIYPQTRMNNYHLGLWCKNNQNKYLKNLSADFYLSAVSPSEFGDQYIDRQVYLAKEFFLQLWRELYIMSPSLQSNTLLYKPENIKYNRLLYFTNTYNANGKDYLIDEPDHKEEDSPYLFVDKLGVIFYYLNSVSFNNAVSLQSNYPLQYSVDETFDIEALRSLLFICLDENGVILPRLSEFKVYLQFSQNQNNAAQAKTTNFNRVISD